MLNRCQTVRKVGPKPQRTSFFSFFQHYDGQASGEALRKAYNEYASARQKKLRNSPGNHVGENPSDSRENSEKYRTLLLDVKAARFKFNTFKHVNDNASSRQAKQFAQQPEMLVEEGIAKETLPSPDEGPFGLMDAWLHVRQQLASLRSLKGTLNAHAARKNQVRIAQLSAVEAKAAEVEAAYHALVLALQPETPGLRYSRLDSAYRTATERVRVTRKKDPLQIARIQRLEKEMERFRVLRNALREGKGVASTTPHAPPSPSATGQYDPPAIPLVILL